MKKLLVFSCLTLSSTLMLSSCAQAPRAASTKKKAPTPKSLTVDIGEDDVSTRASAGDRSTEQEYTHELAEANADDEVIKGAVGSSHDLDEELAADDAPAGKSIPFLKNVRTKRMEFWVEYFTKKQRERFQRFINNGEEYRHHIEEILAAHGLPKELYYVGLIESGYYLGARSHAGAQGPWQFIKGTGTRYGLRITSELDERQDLFKASRAAAMYFKDLHNVFSSWELALSAYNAGEYGILRRIMKHGTRDYYQLSKRKQLPSETINYVPKVLAAMHVIRNAEKYGFVIPKKSLRVFDRTELRNVDKNTSLAAIARRLNVSVEVLKRLNPELKQSRTPRYLAGNYQLRVPASKYSYKVGELAASPSLAHRAPASVAREVSPPARRSKKTFRTTHRVRRGETLISIARKYRLSPGKLAVANNFKTWRTRVKAGQVLKLSSSSKPRKTRRPITYKVRSGDNLIAIASLFDLDVSAIKAFNRLKGNRIYPGQRLVLPNTKKGIYVVKAGDHLTKVARTFNQPLEAIVKINDLRKKTIYPGQKLIVNMD